MDLNHRQALLTSLFYHWTTPEYLSTPPWTRTKNLRIKSALLLTNWASEAWISGNERNRTADESIFSAPLYQLSYITDLVSLFQSPD